MNGKRLVIIGGGGAAFREYALRSVAARAEVFLVAGTPVTWETDYVAGSAVVDLDDWEAVERAVRDVLPVDGVLTYDERYVELTARLTGSLGLPGPTAAAVRAVKDKSAFRALQAEAGLAPLKFGVAGTVEEAHRVVAEVGLPSVFKPRALGGSAGVVLVTDAGQVEEAFAVATEARVGVVRSRYGGALIEEYVDGPEISVDAVTAGGVTTPLVFAAKQTGLEPYFEEVGHVVPAPPEVAGPEVAELVRRAHELAGLDDVVTHTEIRFGSNGPRIIELNARLGGDLIPYLGLLAHGVDLAGAAADIALGNPPSLDRHDDGAAAVRFVYPTHDLRLSSVDLPAAWREHPALDVFAPLGQSGAELRLPPRGYLSRLALVVVRAAERAEALALAEEAAAAVSVTGDALDVS